MCSHCFHTDLPIKADHLLPVFSTVQLFIVTNITPELCFLGLQLNCCLLKSFIISQLLIHHTFPLLLPDISLQSPLYLRLFVQTITSFLILHREICLQAHSREERILMMPAIDS